jgi:AAA domain
LSNYNIPGLKIYGSKEILGPDSKLAMLLWAPSGYGKTKLASTLDRLTQKYNNKRTLLIAVEPSEGGGAATIRKLDIPMMVPKDLSEINKALGTLRNDKTFGGIILDSGTETVKQHVKPVALKYPPKENFATRAIGVPTRSDYQVIGELTSEIFRQLMLMTTHENLEYRKHLIITATDKSEEDDDKIVWRGPDLMGRMAKEAVSIFQLTATIELKSQVVNGKRNVGRYLITSGDGVRAIKDRYEVFPPEIKLRKNLEDPEGMDLCDIWEKYWLPEVQQRVGAV